MAVPWWGFSLLNLFLPLQLAVSSHENATPVKLIHNAAGHLNGPARTIGAGVIGYLGNGNKSCFTRCSKTAFIQTAAPLKENTHASPSLCPCRSPCLRSQTCGHQPAVCGWGGGHLGPGCHGVGCGGAVRGRQSFGVCCEKQPAGQ